MPEPPTVFNPRQQRLEFPVCKLVTAQRILADAHDAGALQAGLDGLVKITVFVVKALNYREKRRNDGRIEPEAG